MNFPKTVNLLLDQHAGSSGKGKMSVLLAQLGGIRNISSANFPNAGHSWVGDDGSKFIAKVLPTAAILNKIEPSIHREFYITPGSGFSWEQFIKEWAACNYPVVYIHEMASIVTEAHKLGESVGAGSTTHCGSTRQGTSGAMIDKLLRKLDCLLAGNTGVKFLEMAAVHLEEHGQPACLLGRVRILRGEDFRNQCAFLMDQCGDWLHEGSQGYALSLDHGIAPSYGTSRNCTAMQAMDYLACPPQRIKDVWLNLRVFPIRVGHITDESGAIIGNSGPFYADQTEITWEEVAASAGMPADEAVLLKQRELTTVTQRLRRVATFSWQGLRDAVMTNGATKLAVNFVQYLNWSDHKKHGTYSELSRETHEFIQKVEEVADVPVCLIGTGACHGDYVIRL